MEYVIDQEKLKASLKDIISDMTGCCEESYVCIFETTNSVGTKIQVHLKATCDDYNFIDKPKPEDFSITQTRYSERLGILDNILEEFHHRASLKSDHDDHIDNSDTQIGIEFCFEKLMNGNQLISEKAISYLYDHHPDAYKDFYDNL